MSSPPPSSSAQAALLPLGAATGVGSLPGTSIRAAVQLVIDELPELLHLPELPARGPGAEMTGRALALLPDFPAQWGPTGWALADRPGHDSRRGVSLLGEDLDAIEELAEGSTGPLKVQLCGPWTLAATVELRSGRKLLADRGATRDLHQAYTQAVTDHLAEVAKRLPTAGLLLQLDEPAIPFVLEGGVPTPSGLTRLAAVDIQEVQGVLRAAAEAVPSVLVGVHCCAASPPLAMLRDSGSRFVSLDATLLTEHDDDPVGELVEAGIRLLLGIDPAAPAEASAVPLRGLWHRLGQPPEQLASVVVKPSCGLAGVSPDAARAALRRCAAVARLLTDDPEGPRG